MGMIDADALISEIDRMCGYTVEIFDINNKLTFSGICVPKKGLIDLIKKEGVIQNDILEKV